MFEIRLDRSSRRPSTQQGFWLINGTVVSECVLAYPEFGDRREYVPASTIAAAAPSLRNVPLTIEHEVATVTPDNYQATTHGHVTESWLTAEGANDFTLQVASRAAMDALDDGTHFVSPAYRVELESRSGTSPAGETHTHVQVRRTYDNLTITKRPRAGERASLRLDGIDTMKRIKILLNGKTYDAPDYLLPGLRADSEATTKTDAGEIKVGKIRITMADGKSVDLTLPEGTINDLLKMLGAGSASPAPAGAKPVDAGAAPPPPGMETDAAPPVEPPKTDSKREDALEQRIEAKLAEDRRMDSRRRDVEAKARTVLGDRQLAGLGEGEIMLQVIGLRTDAAAIKPVAETLAKRMVDLRIDADARGEARGRLSSLFDSTIDTLRTDAAGSGRGDVLEILQAGVRTDSEVRTDKVGDARTAMIERQAKRYKGRAA